MGSNKSKEKSDKEGDMVLLNCAMSTVVNGEAINLPQLQGLTGKLNC